MKRVLVVEDNLHAAEALNIRLRTAGFEVIVARDGMNAAKLAATEPPDVVITDMKLPGMHGLEFLRQLKKLGLSQVPAVVLTGSLRADLWEAAMHLGAAAYFEKPYDPARLIAVVDTMANRSGNSQPANNPEVG